MADPDPRKHVNAAPEKRFFISMLVKDIELIPAILDLVDNSVDGAKRVRPTEDAEPGPGQNGNGPGRFDGLFVYVEVGASRFHMVDNCGGIDVDTARNYAFRFGRPQDVHGPVGEVGQFGVGMKRALFKLGTQFWIESTAANSRFVLPINVPEWEKVDSPDWSFELEEVEEDIEVSPENRGTTLEVSDLHPTVSADLGTTLVQARLRANLELRHQVALAAGLDIRLNDDQLQPHLPQLLIGADLVPIRIAREFEVDGSSVEMGLFAGIAGGEDTSAETDDAQQFRTQSDAGWYMFCNDRLLFAADKSPLTGWGSGAAAYHPQYRQFRGYVYLESADSSVLPWNTTKTGVDEDSEVFRIVQGEMFSALKTVQGVLNRAKAERQDREPEERPLLDAITSAAPEDLEELPASDGFKAPPEPTKPKPRTTDRRHIRYVVEKAEFEAVAGELDLDSAPDVGRATFDYYLEHEVPEG